MKLISFFHFHGCFLWVSLNSSLCIAVVLYKYTCPSSYLLLYFPSLCVFVTSKNSLPKIIRLSKIVVKQQ